MMIEKANANSQGHTVSRTLIYCFEALLDKLEKLFPAPVEAIAEETDGLSYDQKLELSATILAAMKGNPKNVHINGSIKDHQRELAMVAVQQTNALIEAWGNESDK